MKFKINKNLFKVTYEGKEGYVITEDSEININDYFFWYDPDGDNKYIWKSYGNTEDSHIKVEYHNNEFQWEYGDWNKHYAYKIIASTFPLGNLPQFIINKVEDVKKIALENCKTPIINHKEQDINTEIWISGARQYGFIEGWNKHAEKYKFTEEGMKKAIEFAYNAGRRVEMDAVTPDFKFETYREEIIQSLQQLKEITEIEFEMEYGYWKSSVYDQPDKWVEYEIPRIKITKSDEYPHELLTVKNIKLEKI